MAHAAARRRGLSRDESDDRLFNVCLDPRGRDFFRVAADFTDENNCMRFGIVIEEFDGIEERRADDRVATDADTSGLADAEARELVHGLVSERAAATDDANVARLVNTARHNADFALAGRNDAGAIRSDEAR